MAALDITRMAEPFITYEAVAAHLGLKRRGVQLLVQRRAIPVVKLSARCHRFRLSEVDAALARLTVRPRT